MALGVARDEAELAHQILDVVHDEGEAAVELVEALRVGERLLAARLGDVGGGLDAGGAEQVEILPVERGGGTAGWSRMTRPASRPPWISGMPAQASSRPASQSRHRRPCVSPSTSQPCADRVEIEDEAGPARYGGAAPRRRRRAGTGAGPVPARRPGRAGDASSASSSRPPGAPPMSASALTTRSSSGAALRRRAADRVGEAQPFLAIIVAMLEQMLGERDPEPGAQLAPRAAAPARPASSRRRSPTWPTRAQSPPTISIARAAEHHRDQVDEDGDHRDRLEGRGARELDLPARRCAGPSANSGASSGEHDAAQREQLVAGRAGEIGDRVEVEVVGPHRRPARASGSAAPSASPARPGRRDCGPGSARRRRW